MTCFSGSAQSSADVGLASHTDWQALLERPYTDGVPVGYTEDVYSLYQPGWGFDLPAVYRSGSQSGFGMRTEIFVDEQPLPAGDGVHTPAYVTTETPTDPKQLCTYLNHATDADAVKEVSFAQTDYGNTLDMAFDGDTSNIGRNWNTWCPVTRYGDEWLEVRYDSPKALDVLRFWLYTDENVYPPQAVKIQYSENGAWKDASGVTVPALGQGMNTITLDTAVSDAFRFVFTPAEGKSLSFYEIELLERIPLTPAAEVTGYKYLSPDNAAIVILDAANRSDAPAAIRIEVTPLYNASVSGDRFTGAIDGFTLLTAGDGAFAPTDGKLVAELTLGPGETRRFRAVTAFADDAGSAGTALSGLLSSSDPLTDQKTAFLGWFDENVPYADLPDETLKQIYYYRWYLYRSHLRRLADGTYTVTEFLPYVGWSGPYNTINMALGAHADEGRWIRDNRYLQSALTFWTDREGRENARSFSTWLPTAFYQYYLVTRDEAVTDRLDALKADYAAWEAGYYDAGAGLFFSNSGVDGMEYSAVHPNDWGQEGFRPTVNAYRYGDALAIAALCERTGDTEGAALYRGKAETLKKAAVERLFDETESFFKWLPRGSSSLTDPRELIGYVPWMFGLADDTEEQAAAWQYLTDPAYFAAAYGPRTVEKAFARTVPEAEYGTGVCRWDGPSWPFATSQTLNAMANLLNDYEHKGGVTADDYVSLLKTYAASHYKEGSPWLAEDLDADSGRWIADTDRSPLYNHSEYVNLLITGLFGIRPSAGDDLTVNPLVPSDWNWFCLENLRIAGHDVTVLFDRDGSRYGKGSGFRILVDGQTLYTADTVQSVTVSLSGESGADEPTTGESGTGEPAVSPGTGSRILPFLAVPALLLTTGVAVFFRRRKT